MRFVRFRKDNFCSYGLLEGEKVKVIEGDIFKDYKVSSCNYDITEIDILTPCLPSKIVCVGLNYKGHAQETNMTLPKEPLIFLKPATAALAHRGKVIKPAMSGRVDYEGELGLVIGKPAKEIEPKAAYSYILGATCFNDVTARDLQMKDGQWTRGKSFDTFAPMGPFIVTGVDYNNVDIELVLNDETKQKSSTSYFITKAHEIVSYVSKIMTLYPGDVIATGTPSGVGPMVKGDVVEVRINGVGILRNYME